MNISSNGISMCKKFIDADPTGPKPLAISTLYYISYRASKTKFYNYICKKIKIINFCFHIIIYIFQ